MYKLIDSLKVFLSFVFCSPKKNKNKSAYFFSLFAILLLCLLLFDSNYFSFSFFSSNAFPSVLQVNCEELEKQKEENEKKITYGNYVCTQQLVEAYNVAVETVAGLGIRDKLIDRWGVVYRPLLLCPASPPAVLTYPEPLEGDALHEIIKNQVVRVGTIAAAWGTSGDYTKEVPDGFFPDYLEAIFKQIDKHYGTKIKIEYVRLSDKVLASLNNKEIHMTDIYYIYPNVVEDGSAIHDKFFVGCPSCASDTTMLVRKESGIHTLQDLRHRIIHAPDLVGKTVLFQTLANKQAIMHMLPPNTNSVVMTGESRKSETVGRVVHKTALAALSTGRVPHHLMDDNTLLEVELGIVLAMGPIFKKTIDPRCSEEELGVFMKSSGERIVDSPNYFIYALVLLCVSFISMQFLF